MLYVDVDVYASHARSRSLSLSLFRNLSLYFGDLVDGEQTSERVPVRSRSRTFN